MTNNNKDELLEYLKKTPLPNLLHVLYTEYITAVRFIQDMGLEEDYLQFCDEVKLEREYPAFIEGGFPKEVTHEFVEQMKKDPEWNKTEN